MRLKEIIQFFYQFHVPFYFIFHSIACKIKFHKHVTFQNTLHKKQSKSMYRLLNDGVSHEVQLWNNYTLNICLNFLAYLWIPLGMSYTYINKSEQFDVASKHINFSIHEWKRKSVDKLKTLLNTCWKAPSLSTNTVPIKKSSYHKIVVNT